MANKPDVGTIKWLEDGWNGWINDKHFVSMGIGEICDLVAAEVPSKDVTWMVNGGKLTVMASTKITKMSKKDQDV